MPTVEVPPRYRGGPRSGLALIEVEANTVRRCIEAVEVEYPGFRELILDSAGKLRRYVSVIMPVPGLDIIRSEGCIHCITQQEPGP